ncbi:MAG: hypothetical protein AB2417_00660 [Clostridiaceae bacterium]
MKKNILIIRCASERTIEKLLDNINNRYKIEENSLYCLIQKSFITSYEKKYPYIKYIEKEDGFFNYKSFRKNVRLQNQLKNIYFDEICIPSSYIDFPDFEDVFIIASTIKCKKYILFNVDGEMKEQRLDFISLWIDKYLGNIIYFIKLIFALIGISIIYILSYPYYFIKKTLFRNR